MCSVEGTLGRLPNASSLAALRLRLAEFDLWLGPERDFAGREDGSSGFVVAAGWRERFESPLGGQEALLDESRRWRERRVGQAADEERLATAEVEIEADWVPTRAARPSCDENMVGGCGRATVYSCCAVL